MGDVNLEIKLSNLDERVIKIEDSGGGSGGDGYITSVSNDFNVINKKLSLSNDVTTKLSKVDTTDNLSVELAKKIDKPASATNGQVLTYNGTSNEWEAKNPSASITEPTDLEKGIIGGDEWVSGGRYTIGESIVIDENKLYLLVGDGGSTTKPSTDATHSIWEETSISALNSKLGQIYTNTQLKDITVPSSNWIEILTLTLPQKGIYLITFGLRLGTASTSTPLYIGLGDDLVNNLYANQVVSTETALSFTVVYDCKEDNKVLKLGAWVGISVKANSGKIIACRIK